MEAVNGNIAVTPFPEQKAIKRLGPALAVGGHMSLVRLTVVIGNDRYPRGSTVLVRANHAASPWAREMFEAEGIEGNFVFIPEAIVSCVETNAPYSVSLASSSVGVSAPASTDHIHVAG